MLPLVKTSMARCPTSIGPCPAHMKVRALIQQHLASVIINVLSMKSNQQKSIFSTEIFNFRNRNAPLNFNEHQAMNKKQLDDIIKEICHPLKQ